MTAAQPPAIAGDLSPDPPANGPPTQPPAGFTQPTLWDDEPFEPPATSKSLVAAQGYPRNTSARLARFYTATTADRPTAADQPRLLASTLGPRVPWAAIRTAHHPGRIVLLLATGGKPPAAQLRAAADAATNTLTAPLRRPPAAFPRPPNRTAAYATSPQAAAMPAPQQRNASQPRRG